METSATVYSTSEASLRDELTRANAALAELVSMMIALIVGAFLALLVVYSVGVADGEADGYSRGHLDGHRYADAASSAVLDDLRVCEMLHELHHGDEGTRSPMWRSQYTRILP